MRRLLELFLVCAVACGGRIDDGTDASSVDAGTDVGADAKADVIVTPDTAACAGLGFPCNANAQCCSAICDKGVCGSPPPPCKQDGVSCTSASECCSNACDGTCGATVTCGTTSSKQCDICVAENCCTQFLDCGNDGACSTWLGCVQNCEQQGQSAFACSQAQSTCGPPSGPAENALFKCAQQSCVNSCTVD